MGYVVNLTDGQPTTFAYPSEPDLDLFHWFAPIVDEDNKLALTVVEIPAGTNDKWVVDQVTGIMTWQWKNGAPRTVDYLQYPGNFGITPRSNEKGSDDGAAEVFIIGARFLRAEIPITKIIGVIHLTEGGAIDNRIIATVPGTAMYDCCDDLSELDIEFPGISDILITFFINYKGPNAFVYSGVDDSIEAWAYLVGGVQYLNYTGEDHKLPVLQENCTAIPSLLAKNFTESADKLSLVNTYDPSYNLYTDSDWYDHTAAGYQSVIQAVEIPSGDLNVWNVDISTGKMVRKTVDGTPYTISYLGYPGNHGIVPRTLMGDGKAMEVITIGKEALRADYVSAKLIGIMHTNETSGTTTTVRDRLIAIAPGCAMFSAVDDLPDLDATYVGVSNILSAWYSNYDAPRKSAQRHTSWFGDAAEAKSAVVAANQRYINSLPSSSSAAQPSSTPATSSQSPPPKSSSGSAGSIAISMFMMVIALVCALLA